MQVALVAFSLHHHHAQLLSLSDFTLHHCLLLLCSFSADHLLFHHFITLSVHLIRRFSPRFVLLMIQTVLALPTICLTFCIYV